MAWYKCQNCKGVFESAFSYATHDLACPRCTTKGQALLFKGDVRDLILDEEEQDISALENEIRGDRELREDCIQDLTNLKVAYERSDLVVADTRGRISGLKTAISMLESKLQASMKKLESRKAERAVLRKAAAKVYTDSKDVRHLSKKNKLYIGSRQYVASCVKGSELKKKRILDSNVWTWGLNVSWVEGGVNAQARFTIKVNSVNQYERIPENVMQWLATHAKPSLDETTRAALANDFLEQCRTSGKGSLLWYDRDGEDRPTWTALEMAVLLSRGYSFRFPEGASSNSPSKLYLLPPN